MIPQVRMDRTLCCPPFFFFFFFLIDAAPPPFFVFFVYLNIDFFSYEQHFATFYVSLYDQHFVAKCCLYEKKEKKRGGTASIKRIYKKRGGNIGSCPHVPVDDPYTLASPDAITNNFNDIDI